jgi:hypothetical protein
VRRKMTPTVREAGDMLQYARSSYVPLAESVMLINWWEECHV